MEKIIFCVEKNTYELIDIFIFIFKMKAIPVAGCLILFVLIDVAIKKSNKKTLTLTQEVLHTNEKLWLRESIKRNLNE